jgi:hypothetical protein
VKKEGKGQKGFIQHLAYGDENEGVMTLAEVPQNLRDVNLGELETISKFFIREVEKCDYVKARRVTMKEEYELNLRTKAIEQAKADAAKEAEMSQEAEKEVAAEEAYQDYLLQTKVKLGLLTEEDLETLKAAKKKN